MFTGGNAAMSETSATPHKVSAEKHKGTRHELHRMTIEKAEKGGYVATHSFRPKNKARRGEQMMGMGAHKPDETHAFQDFASMHAHMAGAFGEHAADAASNTQEGDEELPTSKKA
jgi:hypothetical protein